MRANNVFFLSVLLLSLVPQAHVLPVVEKANCDGISAINWREARTQTFAILYPLESEVLGQALSTWYGETLDAEYARFEALFETSLSLPIFLRIYPTESHYYCLNAQPPDIAPGATHGHIGSREIALIAENIAGDPAAWLRNSLNVFRYEQAILFAEHISDRQIPPGLLTAIGHYAQEPAQTMGVLQLSPQDWLEPVYTWQHLWEDPATAFDFRQRLETTSIVAFLVDVKGWPQFLHFINSLRTSGSYRRSLAEAYGTEYSALHDQWQSYFSQYFSERWQVNVIYNYDLSSFQELLVVGRYREALTGLREVLPFLEKINQTEKLNEARGMVEWATTGQEAEALVAQSYHSLQAGEYQRSIELADQAEEKFSRIRNFNHVDELNAHRDRIRKILALHEELEHLQAEVSANKKSYSLVSQLVSVAQRMAELGDARGQAEARDLARIIQSRQRNQQVLFSAVGAAIILMLLGVRIWLLRTEIPPEAQL